MIEEFPAEDIGEDEAGEGDDYAPPPAEEVGPLPEQQNIAELMDEAELATLGADLLELVERDIASRDEWQNVARRGMKAFGLLVEAFSAGENGGTQEEQSKAQKSDGSRMVYPLLSEAIMRFAANASKELFPPEGPAKAPSVPQAAQEQADRKSKYVNWLYTSPDGIPDAQREFEKMLCASAREGDVFRAPYWDQEYGGPDVATIEAGDLIMPISARSVYRAPRVTHRMVRDKQWVRDWQDTGYFRAAVDIDTMARGSADEGSTAEKRRIQGMSDGDGRATDPDDDAAEVTIYKMQVRRTIEADPLARKEFIDPDTQEPYSESQRASYLVWFTDQGEVLAIYPNWVEGAPVSRRKRMYVSYPMLLVDGCVYGVGLYHLIGYMAETATDCVRALIDAAKAHNNPAHFMSEECSLEKLKDKGPLRPGELRQVPFAGTDFKQALHTINFAAPSPVLVELLMRIVEEARRLASTADMMVGDAKNTGPVGTTVALIEQGSVVYTAVHKRHHCSLGEEMHLLSRELRENIAPDMLYPFEVFGKQVDVPILEDFDGVGDVEPISDPRIFSKTQRIAKGQALMQLAQAAPQLYDLREVHTRMLEAIEEDEIDELLPPPEQAQRMDAMSENMAMLYGKPVAVYPDQDHKAHAAIHGAVKTDPRFIALFQTLPPEMQQQAQAKMMEHEAQHLAWDYKQSMVGQIGLMTGVDPTASPSLVQAPPFATPQPEGAPQPMHPPEVERQLDQLAAAAVAVQQAQQREMMMMQQAAMAAQAAAGGGGGGVNDNRPVVQ